MSIVIFLAGCSSDDSSETKNSSVHQTEQIISSDAEYFSEPNDESRKSDVITLSVNVKKYENETLTFEYQGKEYSLKAGLSQFRDINYYDKLHTSVEISPMIINCGLSDDITAELVTDKNITEIVSCDVVKDNGIPFDSQSDLPVNWTAETESDYYFKHRYLGHGKYELSNSVRTIYLDMNSLNNYAKCYIPEGVDIVFTGYLLNNNYLLTEFLSCYDRSVVLPDGGHEMIDLINSDKYSFFGKIVNITDDKAEIRLNDNKTVCTIPTDFTDGELTAGMEVMVTLNAGTELYGSGNEYKDDFAVFHTDPKEYNTSGSKFSELAYAQYDKANIFEYIYTKTDEIR